MNKMKNNIFTPYCDKLAHVFGCAYLVLVLQMCMEVFVACWIVISLAIVKELVDKYLLGSRADWKDLAADVVGIGIALVPLFVLSKTPFR